MLIVFVYDVLAAFPWCHLCGSGKIKVH